jgi:hypothetical protein
MNGCLIFFVFLKTLFFLKNEVDGNYAVLTLVLFEPCEKVYFLPPSVFFFVLIVKSGKFGF